MSFAVVPLLDGDFAVIMDSVRKDEYTAIWTFVRFNSEQAAEAWSKDRREGKPEDPPLARETVEAGYGGPPFDDFWQDISSLAYMLDSEPAENRRERIAHFLEHTPSPDCSTFESFRRYAALGLLRVWLNGPLETETQEHVSRVVGAALGVKPFVDLKAELDSDDDDNEEGGPVPR
jgi:hypothetical protein